MKYRIAIWAVAGFLVAGAWAVYFLVRSKDLAIEPIVSTLLRLTCPIAIVGAHYPVSIYSALAANVAAYAVVGLVVETLRQWQQTIHASSEIKEDGTVKTWELHKQPK